MWINRIYVISISFSLYSSLSSYDFISEYIYIYITTPSKIFYSSICAETLRIARASNNSNSFSSSIKPLVTLMLKQGAYKEKLSNTLCKFFNKRQNDFQYVAKIAQELLTLIF